MSSLCIVGAGITGLSLLLLLQEANTDLSKVTIIDPYFDGGDLARRWGPILSNTPWSKTSNTLRSTCPSLVFQDIADPTRTTPLIEIAHLIRGLAAPALKRVRQIQGTVVGTDLSGDSWITRYTTSGKQQSLVSKAIVLSQGGEPKALDLPIPSIPLECALDPHRLKGYVRPGQRALVFGTMHSGTLVMRNLHDLSANTVAAYNTSEPFVWDRDGAYDGIKEEAATIADAIVRGEYKQTKLIPVSNTSAIIRAALEADWVIYAMGFTPRSNIILRVNGQEQPASLYDGKTGCISSSKNAWGFGTAYPNQAPDGKHWDVSVAAFLTHMKEQLPQILAVL
jgi:hypothetical protein